MSTRGRGGGARTIAKRAGYKRKKRQCELGTLCPYQHKYQHKQEYSHDLSEDSSTKAPRSGDGRKPKGTLLQHTSGALKGTGPRGRVVAVPSDRRRAERAAAQHGDQIPGDDPRASQRARWVTQMQEQLLQQQPRSSDSRANDGEAGEARNFRRGRCAVQRDQRPPPPTNGPEPVHARDGRYVRPEQRTQASALEQVSNSGMGVCVDWQEQRQRRGVEYIEISSSDGDGEDHEPEELSNTNNDESSAAAAVILQKPPPRDRGADLEGYGQGEGRRGHGLGDYRCWDCKSCTFRNSNMMALACAVCGVERVF